MGWVHVVPWLLAPSLTSLDGQVSLFYTLSKVHLGYLQWVSAFLRCSISFWRRSGLLQIVLALWVRELITLYLAERWWWLSHCKYWSICVSCLYTVIDSSPSVSGFTMVYKKGMAPSSLLFSTVNCVAGLTLLMCCRKLFLFTDFWMTNVSSTYLHHKLGVRVVLRAFCLKYSMQGLAKMGLTGEPLAVPLTFS